MKAKPTKPKPKNRLPKLDRLRLVPTARRVPPPPSARQFEMWVKDVQNQLTLIRLDVGANERKSDAVLARVEKVVEHVGTFLNHVVRLTHEKETLQRRLTDVQIAAGLRSIVPVYRCAICKTAYASAAIAERCCRNRKSVPGEPSLASRQWE